VVACIYYGSKDGIQHTLDVFLDLLKQLIQEQGHFEHVKRFHDHHTNKNTHPRLSECVQVLLSQVQTCSRVFIVIDALDECPEDDRLELIDNLAILQDKVYLLFTSRPHLNLPAFFQEMKEIHIVPRDEDIRSYVKAKILKPTSRIQRFLRYDGSLQNTILDTIVRKASGM
jgi:hypothetical protein